MAHFAKLNANGAVIKIHVVNNNDAPTEEAGIKFLQTLNKETDTIYKQTSYNTHLRVHYTQEHYPEGHENEGKLIPSEDQSKAFRGNYAAIGGHYDEVKDIFVGKKPYLSWESYDDNGMWLPVTPAPSLFEHNGKQLITTFDDDNVRWVGMEGDSPPPVSISDFNLYWDPSTETWNDIVS
tara:strand:+ start:145 stop:684 length:540 start_codon:yes stop_codon:yes gene_type:complete